MNIQSLGHVVIKVRSRERAEKFYSEILGIPMVARFDPGMAFFSLGNHHDFAVVEVGDDAEPPPAKALGLAHVAFKIGESIEELREAKAHLKSHGIEVKPIDHEVTQSLYFEDPDGNPLEIYIDASDSWKQDPSRVAQYRPLDL